MGVTRLGAGAGAMTAGTAATFNSPNVAASDTSTYAIVGVAISVSSNSTSTTCAVTYGGVSMTQLGLTLLGSSTSRNARGLYYLADPGTGVKSVVVTPGGTSTKAGLVTQVVVFSGVGSVGSYLTASATTHAPVSVVGGYDVRMLVNGATLSSPNQTNEYLNGQTVGGVGDYGCMQSAVGTDSTISFTCSGTATTPGSSAVALSPPVHTGTIASSVKKATASLTGVMQPQGSIAASAKKPTASFTGKHLPKISTLTDNFSTDIGKWYGYGSYITYDGQLKITPPSATPEELIADRGYDLTGNSICLEVPTAIPDAGYDVADLWLFSTVDATDGICIGYEDGNMHYRHRVNDVTNSTWTVPYNATDHRWWRIRESGGQLYWDTAPDGVTWVNRRQLAVGAIDITDLRPHILGYSEAATPGTFVFDNLNLPTPRATVAAQLQKLLFSGAGSQTAPATSGTVASALQKALFSGVGGQTQTGVVAGLLKKATAALAGHEQPRGVVVSAAAKPVASFAGGHTQTGTAAATLRRPTVSVAGQEHPRAAVGSTVAKTTASLAGVQVHSGTLAAAGKKPVAAVSGTSLMSFTGAVAAAACQVTAALAGIEHPRGAVASTAAKPAATLGAAQTYTGVLAAAAAHPVAALSGHMRAAGVVSAEVEQLEATLSGRQTFTGTISSAVKKAAAAVVASAAGAPGTIAAALHHLTVVVSGGMPPRGTIAATGQHPTVTVQATHIEAGAITAAGKHVVAALAGGMQPQGVVAGGLRHPTMSASAQKVYVAQMAAVLHPGRGTVSGSAWMPGQAALTATVHTLTAAAVGGQRQTGALAASEHSVAFGGSASQAQQGALDAAMRAAAAALAGLMAPEAGMAVILSRLSFTATGTYLEMFVVGAVTAALHPPGFTGTAWARPDTPPDRWIVAADNRLLLVGADARTVTVTADPVRVITAADDRTVLVPADDRTV